MKRVFFLLKGVLLVTIVLMLTLVWLVQTNSGAKALLGLVNAFAPVTIEYTDLKGNISSLSLSDAEIKSAALDITSRHLTLAWDPISALFKNNIQVETLTASHVFIIPKMTDPKTTSPENAQSKATKPTAQLGDWGLPFTLNIQSALITDLHIESLYKEAIKHLALSIQLEKEQWIIKELSIEHPEFNAELGGQLIPLKNFSHSLEINFDSPHMGHGKMTVDGDYERSQLDLSIPKQNAHLNATLLNWLKEPSAEFSLDINTIDLAGVPIQLAAIGRGTLGEGSLSLNGLIDEQAITINTLNYQRKNGDYKLESQGIFSDGPYTLNADFSPTQLHNSELTWAPKLPIDNLKIKSSLTRTQGAWDKLNIISNAQVTLGKQAATLDLNAQLNDLKNLNLTASKLSLLGGQLDLSGSASLQTPYQLKLAGLAHDIHLEKLNAILPQLNHGVLNVSWAQENKTSILSATLSDLQATVKNKPIVGSARLDMTDHIIDQATLSLNAGTANHVKIDLIDQNTQTLLLNTNIQNVGAFINNASGTVTGKLHIDTTSILLDGQLVAKNLHIPELVTLAELSLNASHLSSTQSLSIKGRDFQIKEYRIKTASLNAKGKAEQHQLDAQLTDSKERSLNLSGQGQWKNNTYGLKLNTLASHSPELGVVSNHAPIELFYSEKNTVLKPFCLSSEIAQLCGDVQKTNTRPGDSVSGQFELNLTPEQSNRPISQQVGTLTFIPIANTLITASFQIDNNEFSKLDVDASLAKLAIRNQEDESLEINNLALIAKGVRNQITLNLNADAAGGKIDLQGYLRGPINDPSIEATLKGNLPDLQDISPLLITTDIREGDLEIEMQISGKTKAPRVSGFAKLNNTKIIIPELGTTQQINANFSIAASRNGSISGTIISGEGKGTLNGDIKWEKEPIINMSLEANNLLIAETDSLSLSASPTLLLNYAPGKLDVSGTINIERAFSNLAVSGSTASLSNDVIITDTENTANIQNTQQLRNIDISTEFINPARIDGYGITGAVTGKLRITQKDSGPVLGNGQLKITGQYRAFGQVLQIESGYLNYVNTALDNPSIEFYASRKIDNVKVGVRVSGRPDALVSRLESSPSMREADILNYLVLGKAPGASSEAESNQLSQAALALALARSESGIQMVADKAGLSELSLSQELGGLALSVGKQLSPRLYIGYTMGFVEPINIAKVRYMLSSKWILESKISDETRALIKYRFEKD